MRTGPKPSDFLTRFWGKVDDTHSCWHWTGTIDAHGYGCIANGKRPGGTTRVLKAHVMAWTLTHCAEPQGDIDHLCRVTKCVNPDHMEVVTRAENARRQMIHRYHGA